MANFQHSVYFNSDDTQIQVPLANDGDGLLSWQVTKKPDWINVEPSGGFLNAGETVGLILTVSRHGLVGGTYREAITLTTSDGTGGIYVTMMVGSSIGKYIILGALAGLAYLYFTRRK